MAERQNTLARHPRKTSRTAPGVSAHGPTPSALPTGPRGQSARSRDIEAANDTPTPQVDKAPKADTSKNKRRKKQVADSAFTEFLAGKWGTAREACRYLSLSLSVVRRETRAGRIRAYAVGGRKLIRYRKSDLDAYLESQAVVVPFTPRKRA
jgi:excisionase family DNA binding protein